MQEFEAHFLNIDPDKIEKRLLDLGATFVGEFDLKETIFDTYERTWNKKQQFIRIRTKGKKSEMTYKEEIKADHMGGRLEIETDIEDPEKMKLILEKLGVKPVRIQEKKRKTYKRDDVIYDIDWWPQTPPYLEVESDSEEKVHKASEELGLSWEDACMLDAKKILQEIYGFKNFDQIKIFTFDKIEYDQNLKF